MSEKKTRRRWKLRIVLSGLGGSIQIPRRNQPDAVLRLEEASAGLGGEDFRPFHDRLQAAADGLDFGQFRHSGLITFKSFTLWR